jgi:enamine deaminase RidA (YjgF/YER057c/UK114 family)
MPPHDRFDRFTDRARHVLTLAQDEAQRFNHAYIGTEHLLLGLVRETDGVAALVLRGMRIDLAKVRTAVEFIIGHGDRPVAGEVGLTPAAKRVIELAIDEARRLGHRYVGTEHLLLGLVREGEGIAAGVLESLGVDLDKARHEVIRTLALRARAQPGGAFAGSTGMHTDFGLSTVVDDPRRSPISDPHDFQTSFVIERAPRALIGSGSPFEATVGFSRAVRSGDRILISGTAPVWPDGSVDPDVAVQARRCFEIILTALAEAGGEPRHIIRTRMFIVDAADGAAVGRVHGEIFGGIRPAATMVVVAGLLDPRWKVEIEAEALLDS